jgi:hypothetical protein
MLAAALANHRIVILNGGEAGVRDRTGSREWMLLMGIPLAHAAWYFLSAAVARHGFVRSLGGLRPPQDDIKEVRRRLIRFFETPAYFAFMISLNKSGFDSSRTRCG